MVTLREEWEKEVKDPTVLKIWKDIRIESGGGEASPLTQFTTNVKGDVVSAVQRIHDRRSLASRRSDESQNAPLTTDEEEWRKKPNRLDDSGVDTISGEIIMQRAFTAVNALKKTGHIHDFSYEKYANVRAYGEFFATGRRRKEKVTETSTLTGNPFTYMKHVSSGKPEVHVYKAPVMKLSSGNFPLWKEDIPHRGHTIAHESGHAMDWVKKPEHVMEDISGVGTYTFPFSKEVKTAHTQDMLKLTKQMRGTYTPERRRYREKSTELIADAFSSYIIQPRTTRRESKALYEKLDVTANELFGVGWRKRFKPKKIKGKYIIE